jgi:hypothetical protein
MADWYEIVEGPDLAQGDILRACHLYLPQPPSPSPEEGAEIPIQVTVSDVVVMTQSCDLVHDHVTEVLLAKVIPYAAYVADRLRVLPKDEQVKGTRFRQALVAGNVPGISLLHERTEAPALPWSLATFHRLYVLPKEVAARHAESQGARLRLVAPYREHLSQAFARYFMRVGLPLDAKEFEKGGADLLG